MRKIEAEILTHTDHLGLYRLNLAVPKLADVTVERREQGLTQAEGIKPFLAARANLFAKIISQHTTRAEEDADADRFGIVETADLLALEEDVQLYVDAYLGLLESTRSKSVLNLLAQLDAAELRWNVSHVDPGRAFLLAPTHPVRIAWHFQHARMLQSAIRVWQDRSETVADFRELMRQYRHDVQLTHAPAVVFDARGRGYVEQGPLTSHWSLYLPDAGSNGVVVDIAASRDRVRALLGVRRESSVLPTVGCRDLAGRLLEYLQLHPYAEELHLNVFNPGDAGLIADTLREVEKLRRDISGEPALRYVVRLFTPRDSVDLTGVALESLLDPDRQVGEDDEFALASSNHLYPKLVFGRNSIEDFLARPTDFTAHVSIMLEQFAVRSRVGKVDAFRRGSFVSGLLQEPEIHADSWSGVFAWHKGLNPKPSSRADSRGGDTTCTVARPRASQIPLKGCLRLASERPRFLSLTANTAMRLATATGLCAAAIASDIASLRVPTNASSWGSSIST